MEGPGTNKTRFCTRDVLSLVEEMDRPGAGARGGALGPGRHGQGLPWRRGQQYGMLKEKKKSRNQQGARAGRGVSGGGCMPRHAGSRGPLVQGRSVQGGRGQVEKSSGRDTHPRVQGSPVMSSFK